MRVSGLDPAAARMHSFGSASRRGRALQRCAALGRRGPLGRAALRRGPRFSPAPPVLPPTEEEMQQSGRRLSIACLWHSLHNTDKVQGIARHRLNCHSELPNARSDCSTITRYSIYISCAQKTCLRKRQNNTSSHRCSENS